MTENVPRKPEICSPNEQPVHCLWSDLAYFWATTTHAQFCERNDNVLTFPLPPFTGCAHDRARVRHQEDPARYMSALTPASLVGRNQTDSVASRLQCLLSSSPHGVSLHVAAPKHAHVPSPLLLSTANGVAVPEVIALCEDPNVIGTPFYLMHYVPGRIFKGAN